MKFTFFGNTIYVKYIKFLQLYSKTEKSIVNRYAIHY